MSSPILMPRCSAASFLIRLNSDCGMPRLWRISFARSFASRSAWMYAASTDSRSLPTSARLSVSISPPSTSALASSSPSSRTFPL